MTQTVTFNQVSIKRIVAITAPVALLMVSTAQAAGSGLIPCDGTDCTLNSIFQLINNLINFFFTTLLFPIIVIMLIYLGYGYLTAGGKPGQHAKLRSMAMHLVLGLLLMVCAWLIVKTTLSVLGYTDDLMFLSQ